jgi:putative ABC transport system substrate-binding protein
MTNRRTFIAGMAAAIASAPIAAQETPAGKRYRIGFLWDSPDVFPDALEAFRRKLRELGYVEGRNITIEYRWAEGKPARMRELADELVRLKVDVIIAPSSIYTDAAKRATAKIPIVFMSHADPLGSGHISALGRPGGNITGLSLMMTETNVKGLQIFKEAIPGLSRIAVIWDPATPSHAPGLKAVEAAGPSLGLAVQSVAVRSATEYASAFTVIVRERSNGVLVLSTPFFIADAKRLGGAGSYAQTAHVVWSEAPCDCRRTHELLSRSRGPVASRCSVCRQNFERCESSRFTGGATDEVRTCY